MASDGMDPTRKCEKISLPWQHRLGVSLNNTTKLADSENLRLIQESPDRQTCLQSIRVQSSEGCHYVARLQRSVRGTPLLLQWSTDSQPGRCGSEEPCVPEHPSLASPHEQRRWLIIVLNDVFLKCKITSRYGRFGITVRKIPPQWGLVPNFFNEHF